MTQSLQPYREPPSQLPIPPTEFNLGGNRYVLVPQEQVLANPPVVTHQGPVIGGVPYVQTHEGYRPIHQAQAMGYHSPAPYHAHTAHPPWLRNHYIRGSGMLTGAAVIGVGLFIVVAALYAIAVWALAHLIAIGVTIIFAFFGLMALLAAVTKSRHGHPPQRGRY